MHDFKITKIGSSFHIEGFPDAVKVISIDGVHAKLLSDLWLHRHDMRFGKDCLETINKTPDSSKIAREALWRTAIILFFKCFGHSASRHKLLFKDVYGSDEKAKIVFSDMKSLRDKYLVHDDNAYSQSLPGAILNKGNKPFKVDEVACIAFLVESLNQENWNNLYTLVNKALKYIEENLDHTCNIIKKGLEEKPYDELLRLKSITWTTPSPKDIGKTRK